MQVGCHVVFWMWLELEDSDTVWDKAVKEGDSTGWREGGSGFGGDTSWRRAGSDTGSEPVNVKMCTKVPAKSDF